jgi:LAO/AO transport system kinase
MNKNFDISKILAGDRRSVAKAITLVESLNPSDEIRSREMLEKLMMHTGKSIRIGITGVPGVGKSTFIEKFGLLLIEKGHKVAVLAVDPSSPISGGSILGDKTRMEKLTQSDNSFVRPTASAGNLGGVAQKTRESILILESAGYNYILVETVGVGQSEFDVVDMVDFFLVLMLPNAGDELQGIKKGILELADLILINKADGAFKEKAMLAMSQYQGAMELVKHKYFWKTKIQVCSAQEGYYLKEVFDLINDFISISQDNGEFYKNRKNQNVKWFNKLVSSMLDQIINSKQSLKDIKINYINQIESGQILPIYGAREYFQKVVSSFKYEK